MNARQQCTGQSGDKDRIAAGRGGVLGRWGEWVVDPWMESGGWGKAEVVQRRGSASSVEVRERIENGRD